MARYSSYIELSPTYESVVDQSIEIRYENFWEKYIVHGDMVEAIKCVCRSFKPETPDDQRSFWFHGTYGTGKTYSALVLKHLLEDPIEKIESFMSRQLLWEYKDRFLSIRQKGKFLVIWKSGGCDSIVNANRLMMEMEMEIRRTIRNKLGGNAYFGRNSLVEAVKDAINDRTINWEEIYEDPTYLIGSDYPSIEVFRDEVMSSSLKACEMCAQVIIQKGWGLFSNVEQFKNWITDVIQGNNLADTGIVFIWDEFTEYLKQSRETDVLRKLSEFCKQQPFYMMLIVHRDATWVEEFGQDSYEHMVHRYHELEFNINESAAYQLIGDSILIRPGFEDSWREIQDVLLNSIKHKIPEFEGLTLDSKSDAIKSLLPIHPMTLTLLSRVAGNFAASQRTLFRFLKDIHEEHENVGFQYYINNFGPDNWRWLTPDFLWDYFFMRESDVREFGEEALSCYRHYVANQPLLTDKRALNLFKASMLLMAITGNLRSVYTKQKRYDKKVKPSINTMINCFAGQLDKNEVQKYIEELKNLGMLMTIQDGNDQRIELPYDKYGSADDLKKKKEAEKKKYTPHMLLSDDGIFTKALKSQFLDPNKAIAKRIEVEPCSADQASISFRLGQINAKLEKYPYKFGILLVVPRSNEQYQKVQEQLRELTENDRTDRLIIALLKKPLDDHMLDEWYENRAHYLLSVDAGLSASVEQNEAKVNEIMNSWIVTAIDDQMNAYYKGTPYVSIYGRYALIDRMESEVILKLFYAAPENLVKVSTAYRPAQEKAAIAAIRKSTEENRQIMNIVDALKTAGLWENSDISHFSTDHVSDAARAVGLLAKHIRRQLSEKVKINLSELWDELQKPPFGYYDALICSYLLGFIMRHYANTSYYWFDGVNPNILTENNLATMIYKLCRNDVYGNTISTGSETERRFREITQMIFNLTPDQAVNEEQIRKYVRSKISEVGFPFWSLKYAPEEKFGGSTMKEKAIQITNEYALFIQQQGDQNNIMENIVELFKGGGILREAISEILKDKTVLYKSFLTFVLQVNPELKSVVEKAALSPNDLFDSIKELMQEEIYTWSEEDVIEKLGYVYTNTSLVVLLNTTMGTNRKTVEKLSADINNKFERMKIPGRVLEYMNKPWKEALIYLRDISQKVWFSWDLHKRIEVLEILNSYVYDAWANTVDSRGMLKEYLEKLGFEHDQGEIETIYNSLEEVVYNYSEKGFENSVLDRRRKLDYEKDREQLIKLWQENTGTDSITEWCRKYLTPVLWVIPQRLIESIRLLKYIEDGNVVDHLLLKNALNKMADHNYKNITDETYINQCFFKQTEEKYEELLQNYTQDLKGYVVNQCGEDIYSWANNPNDVRKGMEGYIREKMGSQIVEKALTQIKVIDETVLKEKVERLLKENIDLCILFLKN